MMEVYPRYVVKVFIDLAQMNDGTFYEFLIIQFNILKALLPSLFMIHCILHRLAAIFVKSVTSVTL